MQRSYKNILPKWHSSINPEKYYLVLTNDLDSYISCRFLIKDNPTLEIGAFYDFEKLYLNKEKCKDKEPIYVDCDLVCGKCFGNHRTPYLNDEAINLNCFFSGKPYTEKYAGSTIITLIGLYDWNLEDCEDQTLLFFTLIDTWYKQYYQFNRQWKEYAKILELQYLGTVLSQYDLSTCYHLVKEYGLYSKIEATKNPEDGLYHLSSDIKFKEIAEDFRVTIKSYDDLWFDTIAQTFQKKSSSTRELLFNMDKSLVFSCVETFKDSSTYSYYHEKNELLDEGGALIA